MFLFLALSFVSPLCAEANERDTLRLGLSGPVKELTQKRSIFSNRYGKWGPEKEKLVQKLTFDRGGRLLEQEEYESNFRASFAWTRTLTGDRYSIATRTRYQKEGVEFDDYGKIIEKYQSTSGSYKKWEYTYDESGNMVQGKFYRERGAKPVVWTSTYDAKGNPIEVRQARANGTLRSKRAYSYDRQGRIEKQTAEWYAEDGTLDSTWTYRYDSEGNTIEEVYRHAGQSFPSRWKHTYAGTGNHTQETYYTTDGLPFVESQMAYDTRGNKTLEVKSGKGVSRGYRSVSEYDGRNRLIEMVKYDLDGKQVSREVLAYNPQGDLVEKSLHNPDNSLKSKETFVYEYDARGNWTTRKKLTSYNIAEEYDKPMEIFYQTIAYY